MIHHHTKSILTILFLLMPFINCDSTSDSKDTDKNTNDPHFIDNKFDEINKKTDQVKGFIEDIPKFLQSIHAIEKAEKEIADQITSDENKVRTAQGSQRKKRDATLLHEREGEFEGIKINGDELMAHSIDYLNNTLPEVKSKLVDILERFIKENKSTTKYRSTVHQYENDPDFVFPSIIPQSSLSKTLLKYNISLQNEKRELLALENVILKMQTIVESALLEIYKLEDSLQEDAVVHNETVAA